MLFANSTAILTDAFPSEQRGMALGINQVSAIAGSFLGLVIGGLLSEWHWRAVFWVSVPIGILGTVWGYKSLVELGERRRSKIDVPGNLTFGVGLTALLVAITYGIQPYGDHSTGWTNPWVLGGLIGGVVLLMVFVLVEQRVEHPMVSIDLFRIRAFSMGNLAGLLASVGRGGLQFMLIIWLQGIWLPLHGYDYESTPLWAGIYLLPLTVGFLVAGPASGWLSDRFGARLFATGGLLVVAASFVGLLVIPVDFSYWVFAVILIVMGLGSGLFTAPNTSAIMNSVPAYERGAASGIRGTVFNSGISLSIGVFFSLMIVGLADVLPGTLTKGLTAHGVPTKVAEDIGNLPPVGSLFASFLGYNPIESLLGPSGTLDRLPQHNVDVLTGKEFFPHLMSQPFHHGLVIVFVAAAAMSVVGAAASWAAGGKFVHHEADGEALGRE
jgi:MFS family permease